MFLLDKSELLQVPHLIGKITLYKQLLCVFLCVYVCVWGGDGGWGDFHKNEYTVVYME